MRIYREKQPEIIRYLSDTFPHPELLLSVMFDTGSIISGSRALEFFVRGSIDKDSDWDFYVPGYMESVIDMVRVLSAYGVQWYSDTKDWISWLKEHGQIAVKSTQIQNIITWIDRPDIGRSATEALLPKMRQIIEEYTKLVDTPVEERLFRARKVSGQIQLEVHHPRNYRAITEMEVESVKDVTRQMLQKLKRDGDGVWINGTTMYEIWKEQQYVYTAEEQQMMNIVCEAYKHLRDEDGIVEISMRTDKKVEVSIMSGSQVEASIASGSKGGYTEFGKDWNILYGRIPTESGEQPIQLIIGECHGQIRSSLDCIRAFYASHVQCFIGGWCALHMYFNMAKKRQGYLWDLQDGQNPKKVQAAIRKYESRGYEFLKPASTHVEDRNFTNDRQTRFINYADIYNEYVTAREEPFFKEACQKRLEYLGSADWAVYGNKIFFGTQAKDFIARRLEISFKDNWDQISKEDNQRLAGIVGRSMDVKSRKYYSSLGSSLAAKLIPVIETKCLVTSGTTRGRLSYATPLSWLF